MGDVLLKAMHYYVNIKLVTTCNYNKIGLILPCGCLMLPCEQRPTQFPFVKGPSAVSHFASTSITKLQFQGSILLVLFPWLCQNALNLENEFKEIQLKCWRLATPYFQQVELMILFLSGFLSLFSIGKKCSEWICKTFYSCVWRGGSDKQKKTINELNISMFTLEEKEKYVTTMVKWNEEVILDRQGRHASRRNGTAEHRCQLSVLEVKRWIEWARTNPQDKER